MNDLEKKQSELQNEAKEVLEKLDLMNILSSYGTPKIMGSLATGLMTWKDIDIELTNGIDEDKYWDVVKKLFHTPGYKHLNIIDFRNSTNPNSPKGLYACISKFHLYGNDNWKIDIWFLEPNSRDFDFNDWLTKNLKPEHRLSILEIKTQIAMHPKYRKEIFSTDIYKAVIEDNAKDINDFKRYLAKTNRVLD
jgi:hypothetical protein